MLAWILIPWMLSCVSAMPVTPVPAAARHLTFQDRVRAQAILERVRYSHRTGETRPFEKAVPRAVLEAEVSTYLAESAALSSRWGSPITAEALRRETERIAERTRLPGRLRELVNDFEGDTVLLQETVVRSVLADRLARRRFAFDTRLHAESRREAGRIRARLLAGVMNPRDDHPRRHLLVLTDLPVLARPDRQPLVRTISPGELGWLRARALAWPGRVGEVVELSEGFQVDVLVEEKVDRLVLARYEVPKMAWEAWWRETSQDFKADDLPAVAEPLVGFDLSAGAATTSCMPDDTWSPTAGFGVPPTRRTYHTGIWTGSEFIVWGGFGWGGGFQSEPLDTGSRYDPVLDAWNPVSTAGAPTARSRHGAVWTGAEMIVWGGGSDVGSLNSGGRYDPVSDSWNPMSVLNAPAPRSSPAAVWTGSEMIVWGGRNGTTPDGTGGRYDPVSDSWTAMSAVNAPSPRAAPAVWTGTEMIVWGGLAGSAPLDTGGVYVPATDSWSPTSTTGAPAARSDHSMIWTGTEMIVWGGAFLNYTPTSTGARYDPVGDSWSPTTTSGAPSPREFHDAVWTGARMIVWGGGYLIQDGAIVDSSGALYDPGTDTWSATSTTGAPGGRLNGAAAWTGSEMIVWGGDYSVGLGGELGTTDTGGRYDPAANTWALTPMDGQGQARYAHTAVWTGAEMIVWGGVPSLKYPRGKRYDPMLDEWRGVSAVGAPTSGYLHAAVWTGSEMIVWGGTLGGTTGGRYDPATDTWTPTSLVNAPSARVYRPSVVWTGSEMIIWGSTSDSSGGRYEPATDTWTPTSLVNAPSERYLPTAVWTGSEMIVWGDAQDASGGRYDPITDTWSPTSLVNAPAARWFHTAVWTGDRMIVWGGEDWNLGVDLDTGGLYDPSTDTWAPTSTTGAPAARDDATAIWTGREMIVWGGLTPTAALDTGGRYDPALDSWSAVSTTGAPSPRYEQSAVWSGRDMIVWGGRDGSTVTETGGRYAMGQLTDGDLDGYTPCDGDCDDNDSSVWQAPGEVLDLEFTDTSSITWSSPVEPGAQTVAYDLLRSTLPMDFTQGAASCVGIDLPGPSWTEPSDPLPGEIYYYLARAVDGCPLGNGSIGVNSGGQPRLGRNCP